MTEKKKVWKISEIIAEAKFSLGQPPAWIPLGNYKVKIMFAKIRKSSNFNAKLIIKKKGKRTKRIVKLIAENNKTKDNNTTDYDDHKFTVVVDGETADAIAYKPWENKHNVLVGRRRHDTLHALFCLKPKSWGANAAKVVLFDGRSS